MSGRRADVVTKQPMLSKRVGLGRIIIGAHSLLALACGGTSGQTGLTNGSLAAPPTPDAAICHTALSGSACAVQAFWEPVCSAAEYFISCGDSLALVRGQEPIVPPTGCKFFSALPSGKAYYCCPCE